MFQGLCDPHGRQRAKGQPFAPVLDRKASFADVPCTAMGAGWACGRKVRGNPGLPLCPVHLGNQRADVPFVFIPRIDDRLIPGHPGGRSRHQCDECQAIRTTRAAARRVPKPTKPPKPVEHGTFALYRQSCRCQDCVDAYRQYKRLFYRQNAEKIQAQNQARQATLSPEHLERQEAKRAEWRANNSEKVQRYRASREARVLAAHLPEFTYLRSDLIERDGRVCGISDHPLDDGDMWHVDHIIPLNAGGWDAVWNAQPACRSCNVRKQDKGDRVAQEEQVWRHQQALGVEHPLYRPDVAVILGDDPWSDPWNKQWGTPQAMPF